MEETSRLWRLTNRKASQKPEGHSGYRAFPYGRASETADTFSKYEEGDGVKLRLKTSFAYFAVPAILCAASMLTIAISRGASAAGDARSDYNSKCAKCHDRDGRAKSRHAKHEKARDLTTAEWQDSVSDERIYNSISNGKGKMPGFKKKLSDGQMDELVNYVRRLRR